MSTLDGNGSASPPDGRDAGVARLESVSAVAARVDELESLVRTASAVDEKTLKELRRTMDALAKRDPKFEERVSDRVDVIADRLETVTKTVSTTSTAVVAKEGEIVQLRRDLDAALARVDRTAAELRQGSNDAELAEIRQALAELSTLTKQKLPRGLESRVAELADKFALLAQRVDSVSTTVSTTAGGLAGRDGDVIALRRAVEAERDRVAQELTALQRAVDPRPLAELRDALKAQTDEAARQHYATRQLIARTGASVDTLEGQVASVAATLSATADRATETQAGLTTLRTHYAESGEKLNAYLTEQRRALEALSARAASLEQADEEVARNLGEQVTGIASTVDGLKARIDSLSGAVESSTERVAHGEESVSSLRNHVDEAATRLSTLLAEQARSVADVRERTAVLEESTDGVTVQHLDERISAASSRVEELADRFSGVTATLATTSERIDARDAELQALERRFREASSRVEGLVGDLSRSLADIPDPATVTEALQQQNDTIASFADRLTRTETAVADQLRAASSASAETERIASETRVTTSVLSDQLDGLAVRIDSLSGAVVSGTDRIARGEETVSSLRAYVDDAGTRLNALLSDHARSLAALGERATMLEEASSETVERLDERVSAANTRVEVLAGTVDAAASSLRQREDELALRDRQFTAAGTRIESVVDDIREALSAFPELGAVSIEEVASRLERVAERVERSDAAAREHAEARDRLTAEISRKLEAMEAQVATVASDVARAKALWPVALRSLEARLEDVAGHVRPAHPQLEDEPDRRADADLLAGLRDNLQAMETVAAEMARASDVLAPSDEGAATHEAVVAAGATIVPLRSSDP